MKKQKLVTLSLIILICLIGFRVSFFAQAEVRQSTINYLANGPQDAWVTQGLAAAGRDNLDLSYLADFNGQSANEFARTILAVAAARQNPMAFNGQDLVNGLLSYRNNQQIGSINLINDDFWGIIALRAAGYSADSPIISESKNFILTAQNNDGSFSYAPQSAGDSNDTAAAIMALLDAGQSAESEEIQAALSYLHAVQNEDGGFAFTNGESDSGSDAWVIAALNKLGIDPQSWQRSEHSPISHLESLILEDGSFRWLSGDAQGNRLMTAYAAVGLAGRSFPVAYFQAPQDGQNLHHLRIEGQSNTICDAEVAGATALDIVENGAEVCDYSYHIQQTDLGPYLDRINNEQAEGESGWLYRVNWISPMVGAADYQLEEGDYVLWAYGNWAIQPLRIQLSASQAELNEEMTAAVYYLNDQSGEWLAASEATVTAGNRTFQTNGEGQAIFSIAERSTLRVYAEKENFIRSQKELLLVGSGQSETVSLTVNIENDGGGGGNALSFIIDTHDLDFGTLRPGAQAERGVRITNTGDLPAYFETIVSGDALLENNIYLDSQPWENFNTVIQNNNTDDIPVVLRVPQDYRGSGVKEGSLVFWAARQ